jgi:hypothetical protein
LCRFWQLFGLTRASEIAARRTGMKFHQWAAAVED